MRKWTEEQTAFIEACASGKGSISLRAVAGSGKTTTMVRAVNRLIEERPWASVSCVAFNKDIAIELSDRMPPEVDCRTMNSVGHRAWGRHIQKRLEVNTQKTRSNVETLYGKGYYFPEGLEDVPKLVSLAKNSGLVPETWRRSCVNALTDDKPSVWEALITHFDLSIPEGATAKAIKMARNILTQSVKEAFDGQIDFNDQLYMPVCFGGSWQQYSRVFIDEAQDISDIQRVMLANMLKEDAELIAVGDPHQAIYGFRGAASNSMDLIEEEFNTRPMDLTFCFRCSKEVIREAQKIIPHIQWPEGAPEGKVSEMRQFSATTFQAGEAIICRNVRPLIDMAFSLLKRNIPCFVLGRDIGHNINGLIKRLKPEDIGDLVEKLEDYRRWQVQKCQRRGLLEKIESIHDRVDTIQTIIDSLDANASLQDLKRLIDKIFSEMRGGVCLSTIHKAKGLEWKRVYLLDRNLIPSRYAIMPWQQQQEQNLLYVATTRAMEELTYISSGGILE